MNLSAIAMKFRPVVITFAIMLTVWGSITFFNMPRREDPEFTIRSCTVSTVWPGAPTVKVEELITDKIETELANIEEVDYLNSETTNGQSIIYVNLEDSVATKDIQNVWDKVRAKVNQIQMPAQNVRPFVNDEFGDTTILLLGVYQVPLEGSDSVDPEKKYSPRQLEIYADQVRDSLRLIPGIAKVQKFGVQDEAIYIETDQGTWSQVALPTSQLRSLIESRNITSPGGSLDTVNGKFNVKPEGEFTKVNEIKNLSVASVTDGNMTKQVSLADLGLSVRRAYADPPNVICRFTEPRGTFQAIMLGVTMKSGANIVTIGEKAMEKVNELVEVEQILPRDLEVRPVSNLRDNVDAKISDVINNVISAIIIVVIVVYLFVGLRTSLVMAANIPIVVIAAIAIIPFFGVQLEQISLASIIIALGLLVDNAVQVCDQTRTNLLEGAKPSEAAVDGANTLMFPMLSGTLTTVAAFLPMLFALQGGSAEYVYSLPVTLSVTLLISWFFAMTICVVLASGFIRAPKDPSRPSAPLPWLGAFLGNLFKRKSKKKGDDQKDSESTSKDNFILSIYGVAAHIAVKFKWITVLGSAALLVAVLQLPVASEFFPQDRRDQFYINITLPETSTITQTNKIVAQVEDAIIKLSPSTDPETGEAIKRVRTMRSMAGQGGSRWALAVSPPPPGTNTAEILIRTTDGRYTKSLINDLKLAVDLGDQERGISPVAGARVTVKQLQMGPAAAPVELRVTGDGFADINIMRGIADKIKKMLRKEPGTWDISDSWGVDGFQLDVEIDNEKANLSGVSNSAIADTLNTYFAGLKMTTFSEGDHQIPVYFRLKPEDRANLSGIDKAFVEGQNGKVPLNSLAKIVPKWAPGKIARRDQNRSIDVSAEVEDGISGNDVVKKVWNSKEMQDLKASIPNGYKIEIGGALEESQDASVQMLSSFGMSLLAIVLILVIQYNGWSKTLIILATLPLAVIGAWFGLWFTNNPLGFMPQLGLLSLFGIVLNTGIIFIEFADILVEQKYKKLAESYVGSGPMRLPKEDFRSCLVEAGKQRMLPIFLTTATTIGGLVPLALSGGPLWEGMSWLLIFGLIVSTLLTLFVVPALYAIVVETFRIAPVTIPEVGTAIKND